GSAAGGGGRRDREAEPVLLLVARARRVPDPLAGAGAEGDGRGLHGELPAARGRIEGQRAVEADRRDVRRARLALAGREVLEERDPLGEGGLVARDEVGARRDRVHRDRTHELAAQALVAGVAEEEAAGRDVGEAGGRRGGGRQVDRGLELLAAAEEERVGDVGAARGARGDDVAAGRELAAAGEGDRLEVAPPRRLGDGAGQAELGS